ITGCAACTYDSAKVTCTKCDASKYLKTDGTCADSCTTNTEFAKEDPTNGNKCVSCGEASAGGITNCGECSLLSSASRSSTPLVTCTKCENSKYLKEGTCVDKAACTGTTFPNEDNSNANKCLPCNDGTNGITDCVKCTAPSSTGQKPTCSECSNNKIVKTADGEHPASTSLHVTTGFSWRPLQAAVHLRRYAPHVATKTATSVRLLGLTSAASARRLARCI
ncbi:Variant-specific surface protein, partial [Giardia duodenalis]